MVIGVEVEVDCMEGWLFGLVGVGGIFLFFG